MLFSTLSLPVLFGSVASAVAVQFDVDGMVCGVACPPRIQRSLNALDGVEKVVVDYGRSQACIESSVSISAQTVRSILEPDGYSIGALQTVEKCVQAAQISPGDPWAKTDGYDVQVISDGFEFEIEDHLVDDKFIIFDFGASWCGPCHLAAQRFKAVLATTPDLAVRAISLGDDPSLSFEHPVVQQHMAFANGLPWFIVYAPSGKRIYQGGDVDALLKTIERKRK